MNMWADSFDDMRLSINDIYMISLMTGWMLLLMGLFYSYLPGTIVGAALAFGSLYGIRTQAFVTENQYLTGMIPHHSMAVHMSKQLLKKGTRIPAFVQSIVDTQKQEIAFMKEKLIAKNKL